MNARTIKKLVVVGIIAGLIASYFVFDLGHYFSLDYIKASRERFLVLYEDHTLAVISVYFLIYVTATALALPAATILTLAGGALFGLMTGTIVVSFASSIGAALAFVVARYLLRDWVQRRFGDKLEKVNEGIEKDGPFYLFTLRLIPVFPFFAVNTIIALTPMRLFTYYWVSQIGMLPATIVFVNAGKELGQIETISGLLSPSLIISFVLLGIFPLVMKKGLGWYQNRRRENDSI